MTDHDSFAFSEICGELELQGTQVGKEGERERQWNMQKGTTGLGEKEEGAGGIQGKAGWCFLCVLQFLES